MASIDYYTA